jgi:hypothetical protein
MPGSAWTLVGAGGLLLCWLVLMAVLWLTRPDELPGRELLRLLPDVLRLAADRTLPRGVRVRLWLLMVYLAGGFAGRRREGRGPRAVHPGRWRSPPCRRS